jgi:Icc-related predicted phosphoesterase
MIRVVAISDTHGSEHLLSLPKADILIHCGDFHITNLNELEYANRWFGSQNFKYRILVAGNHDTYVEKIGKEMAKSLFTNVWYLEEDMIEIEGLKIYGSPFSPEYNNWAFMYTRRSLEAKKIWEKIPNNIDILATHTMPYGILDTNYCNQHCGCEVLAREVFRKNPKIHIGGHLHNEGGTSKEMFDTTFYNVSLLNEKYQLTNKPTIIEI